MNIANMIREGIKTGEYKNLVECKDCGMFHRKGECYPRGLDAMPATDEEAENFNPYGNEYSKD